jgi:hypothetical protein
MGGRLSNRCRTESICAGVPHRRFRTHDLRSTAEQLSAHGVNEVLAKPVSLDVLIGAIDRLLGTSPA